MTLELRRQGRLDTAPHGSTLSLLRDGARLVRASLGRALRVKGVSFVAGVFSLQRRIEAAFFASGAATQLADAALAGENTAELAVRIAGIARRLTGAGGAAVHLRSPRGVQLLGSDGAHCDGALAEQAMASRSVEWSEKAASVPLEVRGEMVGSLSLCFAQGAQDLRPLRPLLARAGAVLAAAEREARKDRFLSLAAHELKTPLTSIKGFSYSLARRAERGEAFEARHAQVLERQAERLHGLLEEMLEVSRIETGRFALHQEPCEAVELIEASLRSLKRLGADGELNVQVSPGLPLLADRERMERALSAMVQRARTLGTPVQLTASRQGDAAEVRVSWQGAPLEADQLARAFEPRWEDPVGERQGLGMALTVAREAATLHGGGLRAEPQALVLSLPLRSQGPARGPNGGHGRILVVDDDEPLARMLAEFLAEQGFAASFAAGGRAALEKMKLDPPDALVLDLNMPELDGRALLRAARALGLGPRVVLLSADREVAAAARELACEGFVEKPFAPDGLLEAVRRALAPREK